MKTHLVIVIFAALSILSMTTYAQKNEKQSTRESRQLQKQANETTRIEALRAALLEGEFRSELKPSNDNRIQILTVRDKGRHVNVQTYTSQNSNFYNGDSYSYECDKCKYEILNQKEDFVEVKITAPCSSIVGRNSKGRLFHFKVVLSETTHITPL